MLISDLSVRRPVFAAVISLILTLIGLMAVERMPMREYPDIYAPRISIDTTYRGAASDVVERRVTQIIEDEVAGIEGIEKITSTSFDERSHISIEFSGDRDVDSAANDVRDRVSRVLGSLPDEVDFPEIAKVDSSDQPTMFIDLASPSRSVMELTDFARRGLVDELSIIDGVAKVRIDGERRLAMRIWIDPQRLAARGFTVTDIEDALRRENIQLPAGRLTSHQREFTLRTDTGFSTVDDFRRLVIGRGENNYLVRLGEVAEVNIAPEDTRNFSRSNGSAGTSLGIIPQAKANIFQVNRDVSRRIELLRPTLPDDINLEVFLDFATFISESLKQVGKALIVALILVLIVIYGFIGSLRATLIPAVTIPISIVSAFIVMQAMGFSINVITLLGLVLAIGLVVDDAIVVLENIVRRIELGEAPLLAAVNGSREIGFAVIATTLVLVAVFLPVSFMPGDIGHLFAEFGISLAAAVVFSSLIALTLVPMLASKLFRHGLHRSRMTDVVNMVFRRLARSYEKALRFALRFPWIIVAAALLVFASSLQLLYQLPVEYVPREDRGLVMVMIQAPDGASLEYTDNYVRQAEELIYPYMELGVVSGVAVRSSNIESGSDINSGVIFLPLSSWKDRELSASDIASQLNAKFTSLPGVSAFAFTPGSLGLMRGGGPPLQVVLGGTNYDDLADWRDIVMEEAATLPGLINLDSDYRERKPKIDVALDMTRAADLGVSMSNVGRTLETILGSRVVTTFVDRGEEYRVILQGPDDSRRTPSDLNLIYVRSEHSGQLIPLSNLVKLTETSGPMDLRRFDRMRSITISAGLEPGYSLGEALGEVEQIIRNKLPESAQINYNGESREFRQSGRSLYLTFLLALAIAYLVLAAQFESFKHPLIILMTVPLAMTGALLGLTLFDSSVNVYSQIGAIILIGLSAKNGVLIVEFANQLRDRGQNFEEAVIEAAKIRLRPVLMTSMCTAFGAVPLLLASGAGAESRQSIGAVVFFGVSFSLLLTLIVIPAAYLLIAGNTQSPEYIGRLIDGLQRRAKVSGTN